LTHSSDWQKYIDRKTAPMGYATRLGAFREPTPAEKSLALLYEIESWQKSRGIRPYKISAEYSVSQCKELGTSLYDPVNRIPKAVEAYINTPMQIVGKFKDAGIDIEVYKRGPIRKFFDWFTGFFRKADLSDSLSYAEKQVIKKILEQEKE